MVIAYDRERSHRALMRGHQSVRTLEAETKTAGTTLTLSLATVYGPGRPLAYKHRSGSVIARFSPTINYAIVNCIIALVEVALGNVLGFIFQRTREGFNGWAIQNVSMRIKARTVAGAIPGPFCGIPSHDAAQVCTHCGHLMRF